METEVNPDMIKRVYWKGQILPINQVIPAMTDEEFSEWTELNTYIAENIKYKKAIYDPYEVFQPTKAFIKEVLKELNQEAYRLLKEIQKIKQSPAGHWLLEDVEHRHKRVVNRIKRHKAFLNDWSQNSKLDVERAKQVPIQEYYHGKLRKLGNKLWGSCPFGHSDSNPSFVIYADQNSFHCYSCNENGDVIDYIKKTQNLDFVKAVKLLLHL